MILLFGTLAFFLEVVAWAALACWGWSLYPMLGVIFPAGFMMFWGAFLSPKAPRPMLPFSKTLLQSALFILAAYAADRVWRQTFALGFLVCALATVFAALALGLTAHGEPT